MLGTSLIIGFALLLVRFVALEAVFQRARRTASVVRFPVGIGMRVLFRLGGPFLLFVSYKMAQEASTTFDYVAAALVAVLGVGCLIAEPGEITATPNGLVQTSLLGLKRRTIHWPGSAASHPRGLREVLVVGEDGTTITHSQYHVGQSEFLHELKQHHVQLQV
ncbi:MAG: hypothetical protein JST11_05680 [Acidobacteria bacterium]|nr:hypothetical protein [Acidobacteriota bacterium]